MRAGPCVAYGVPRSTAVTVTVGCWAAILSWLVAGVEAFEGAGGVVVVVVLRARIHALLDAEQHRQAEDEQVAEAVAPAHGEARGMAN